MEVREVLGLDIGSKRSGIARASNVAKLAEPLKSVQTEKLLENLKAYLKEHRVSAIAIGLPRNLKGEDTEQTTWVRNWVDKAKPKIQATLYWQDEALTTERAKGLEKMAKKADIDSIAASIILQDFLDASEADRVMC